MKMLTIIIPAYNLGEWLDGCLESIWAQTDQSDRWNVVVVDDGSTDGTGDKLDCWVEKLSARMQVFHIPNGGVNPARQLGLVHAQGKYVWFVDGDDVLHPQAVETYLRLFEQYPDVQIWSHEFKDGEKIVFESLPSIIPHRILTNDFAAVGCMCVCGGVFLRDHIVGQTFPNLLVGEDLLFANRQLARARKVGIVQVPLYGYVMRPSSISHSPSVKRVENAIRFNEEMVRFYTDEGRRLSRSCARGRLVQLLFGLPTEIINGYHAENRKSLLSEWRQSIIGTVMSGRRIHTAIGCIHLFEAVIMRCPLMLNLIARLNRIIFRWYVRNHGVGNV